MVQTSDVGTAQSSEAPPLLILLASTCGGWYLFIVLVQIIGTTQLFRYYSSRPARSTSEQLPADDVPHVTLLRPVKGLEPQLYECLAATFHQTYPQDKLTIYFCISSASDPAFPVLRRLVSDFHLFDVKIFIEEEDPNLSGHRGEASNLGPNPKIRNMSRGYREAKGNIIWIIDCNVWVGRGAAGRMVDKLCGYGPSGKRQMPFKFVHHLPLVVDSVGASAGEEARGLFSLPDYNQDHIASSSTIAHNFHQKTLDESTLAKTIRIGGGRLEEMFMASSHGKFYTAINTVSVAPCVVGKSNMFRRSHLNFLTSSSSPYSPGIDFFSDSICEDHLIGDLLWRKKVPAEKAGEKWGKHAVVFGDLAIQPMTGMSIREYTARRVRWLRVRKYTVTLATLVEPGVESLLCSAYGAFAVTTIPWFGTTLGIPQSWAAFGLFWLLSVTVWIVADYFVYRKLHSGSSIDLDEQTPSFARPPGGRSRRSLTEWLAAWWGRELLALPVWTWAVWGGATVLWRSKTFWVGMDMKVYEIKEKESLMSTSSSRNGSANSRSKDRRD